MKYADLGTVADVARDHRVTREAVRAWLKYPGCPEPVAFIRGRERLFDLEDWRVWCAKKKLGRRL